MTTTDFRGYPPSLDIAIPRVGLGEVDIASALAAVYAPGGNLRRSV